MQYIRVTIASFLVVLAALGCGSPKTDVYKNHVTSIDSQAVINRDCSKNIRQRHIEALKWLDEQKLTSGTRVEDVQIVLAKALFVLKTKEAPDTHVYKFPLFAPLGEVQLPNEPRHAYDYYGVWVNTFSGTIVKTKFVKHKW